MFMAKHEQSLPVCTCAVRETWEESERWAIVWFKNSICAHTSTHAVVEAQNRKVLTSGLTSFSFFCFLFSSLAHLSLFCFLLFIHSDRNKKRGKNEQRENEAWSTRKTKSLCHCGKPSTTAVLCWRVLGNMRSVKQCVHCDAHSLYSHPSSVTVVAFQDQPQNGEK